MDTRLPIAATAGMIQISPDTVSLARGRGGESLVSYDLDHGLAQWARIRWQLQPWCPMQTIIEPFRFKVVEPIPMPSLEERRQALAEAELNLFRLPARSVTFDLLTDSGTSAMSAAQWAAMIRGDEAYAGSDSWYRFQKEVRDITGFSQVLPCHQGRAAERILFGLLCKPEHVVPANTHFDTTRANVEATGARAVDIPAAQAHETDTRYPFKGNLDVAALERLIDEHGREAIPLVIMTVTNNAVGGQPVSMANLRETAEICRRHSIPLWIDAARFAENAWFIRQREPGMEDRSPTSIAAEMFSLASGCLMSAKKDAFANIGGFVACHDRELAAEARNQLILTEGFVTYGGLAGRDLEAIAIGLREVLDPAYLAYRVRSIAYFGEWLERVGIPTLRPFGGHAVYINAAKLLPHLEPRDYPAQALACALYEAIGIRGVEVGSVMLGRTDPDTNQLVPAPMELVRLALPRRVYTQSHIDYMIEGMGALVPDLPNLPGVEITWEPPFLRHFTARFVRKTR